MLVTAGSRRRALRASQLVVLILLTLGCGIKDAETTVVDVDIRLPELGIQATQEGTYALLLPQCSRDVKTGGVILSRFESGETLWAVVTKDPLELPPALTIGQVPTGMREAVPLTTNLTEGGSLFVSVTGEETFGGRATFEVDDLRVDYVLRKGRLLTPAEFERKAARDCDELARGTD